MSRGREPTTPAPPPPGAVNRRDLIAGTTAGLLTGSGAVAATPAPSAPSTSPPGARPAPPGWPATLPTTFAIDAKAGDMVLPGLGDTSFAIRRVRLRARDGVSAATVAAGLVTDGVAPRWVGIADDAGALVARVEAQAPPVLLAPTRRNVIASDFDLRGTRFPAFRLSEVVGRGQLEVTLDLEPIAMLAPSFEDGARAAAAAAAETAVPHGLVRDGAGEVGTIADPLFGRHRVTRCTAAGGGRAAVALAPVAEGGDDAWLYGALRWWELPDDGASTPLLRGYAGTDEEVFELQVVGGAVPALQLRVAGGMVPTAVPLGALGEHWSDHDPTARPTTSELVPLLVHYRAGGTVHVWLRDVTGTPRAVVPHGLTRRLARVELGVLRPGGAAARTIDLEGAAWWHDDPRRS